MDSFFNFGGGGQDKSNDESSKPKNSVSFINLMNPLSPNKAPATSAASSSFRVCDKEKKPLPMSLVFRIDKSEQTVRDTKIVAAYIAAFPPYPDTALYNVWAFVFRINPIDTIQVTLEDLPRACGMSEVSDTFIQVAPGPAISLNGRLDGMSKTFKISVKNGTTIGDFLDELFKNKLNKYQLINGRGKRHWVHRILRVATDTFHAHDENGFAMAYLRQGWEKEFPIRPGDYQTLWKGLWLEVPGANTEHQRKVIPYNPRS